MRCITVFTLICMNFASAQQIFFIRGDSVCSYSLSDKKCTLISRLPPNIVSSSHEFSIAPGATCVSYTKPVPTLKERWRRDIAVFTFADHKETQLTDTPLRNAFGPLWSPDGRKLAFHCMFPTNNSSTDKIWKITFSDRNLRQFSTPFSDNSEQNVLYFTWFSNTELITLTGNSWEIIDTTGKIIQRDSLPETTTQGVFDGHFSPNVLSISPDRRFLAFITPVDDEGSENFEIGPGYNAIFICSRTNKSLIRVTDKSISITSLPIWFPNSTELLFSAREARKSHTQKYQPINIYKLSIVASTVTKLIPNADYPTFTNE